MDSVPQGGNFDGLAGVVAGFLLLANLKEKKIRTSLPVKVLILRKLNHHKQDILVHLGWRRKIIPKH